MLTWLDQKQQKEIKLQPREEAPDFLITQARFLDYQVNDNESGDQVEGELVLSIKSKTLSHFSSTKTTLFTEPVVDYKDESGESWLITAETASTQRDSENENDSLIFEGSVSLMSIQKQSMSMESHRIAIDPTLETLTAEDAVNIRFPGGSLTAGHLTSSMNDGVITLNQGVKATYLKSLQPNKGI